VQLSFSSIPKVRYLPIKNADLLEILLVHTTFVGKPKIKKSCTNFETLQMLQNVKCCDVS